MTRGEKLDDLIPIADRFKPSGKVVEVREFGSGLVNGTFLVTLDSGDVSRFILQRVNTSVFLRPKRLMRNLRTISEHVQGRLKADPPGAGRHWELPHPLLTVDGEDNWIGPGGSFWRAISFIDEAQTFDTIQDETHAGEVGHAIGTFQNLLSGLPAEKLAVTLEGFHDTPRYLRRFDEVLENNSPKNSAEADRALKFVSSQREWSSLLEEARVAGKLGLRPIHGDPKVNNVMVDTHSGQAVAMIDLDTAGPGLIHYDIGDCLRSCCNPLGEETGEWEEIIFDPDLCRAVLSGYLPSAGAFFTDADYEYLFGAVRLIAFELGLRFLTDFFEGNVYFRVQDEAHNLRRALVQFKLAESIEAQEKTIRAIIRDLR